MGRKLAAFWKHAERMGNRFKCKFCKQVFPGGVVRLRAHLSGIKGQGIQVCSKVPEDVKSTALLASNDGPIKKKSKLKTSSSNSDITSPQICDARCSNEVDSSLAKFFELNNISSSIVESPSFINLVNVLINSGSGYVLPSCSTLENQLILSLRKEVEQYVSIARQSWEEIGCTLVFDIWHSEKEKRSFISIMACSGKKAVLLNTFEIPNNNLTASFLEEVVHFVVEYVGADKVVQYFVDDTQCSEEIAKLLISKCPHVFTTRCVVRELESFFEEVHQDVEWIRATFETAECLVDVMYKDGDLLALMRKYTGGKELKQSPGYDMLESIFEVREDLVKFAQSPEWLASGYDLQENGKKANAIITSEEFWKQGKEVLIALKPLSTILHLDDASDSSFGYLYGLVKVAEEVIANLQINKWDEYQKLWSIFELKKSRIIHETHKAASFLNPANLCSATVQEMEEGINYIIHKFVATADRVAFVEQALHYRQTLLDPSEHFKKIAAKTSTPYQWWNVFGDLFPLLKKHAIRILCQPCGSSSYNGFLGAFRANLIKQRGLVPELNDLNVRMSLFLMEKCKADSADKSKRISIEEFGQHKSINGNSDAALVEQRYNEDRRPLIITSGEFPRPKHLKLRFMTVIASPIFTGQKVEGHQGYPIHVYLVDSATDSVVQEEAQSMLTLTIAVFDGDFTNEASADECRTREYFDNNDLCSDVMPLVTGDLQVTLVKGVGILGDFSFNYSSRNTRSGKFRLAIKTDTGDCEGIRILEGISNDFVVKDNEAVTRTQHPAALEMHLSKDSASLGGIAPMEGWWGPLEQMLGESSSSPGDWNGSMWNYNHLHRSCRSLTQTAARKVKKKALLWRSRSCNLRIKMKRSRSPKPLDKEAIVGAEFQCPAQLQTLLQSPVTGNEVFEAAGVQLTIRNNVNQQEDNGENGEPKAVLEEIDFFNTNSIESPAVTPFGIGISTSGTEPRPRPSGETSEVQSPKHLSTPWQLSLTEDEVPESVEALHSISEGGKTVNQEKNIEAKLRAWEFEAEEHEWEASGKYVTPHMFAKTLTTSDTSPDGVFPVLRCHAGDCFPPLDLSQNNPSQELVAKDLQGVAWRFTHIYRGQPRRHLLTTGWSTFINHKKLVAGDAVLFLRGEDGELRLGIRRAIQSKRASTMLFGVQVGSSDTAVGKTYIRKENKSIAELVSFETVEEVAPAARETIGNEVFEAAGMQLTIRKSVNQKQDDTLQEVEENQCVGDNYKSDSSVKSIVGMKFQPSDAQILDYLKRRISEHLEGSPNSMSDIIPDVDLYGQTPPWDLPSYFESSLAQGSNRDTWYFFCPRKEKYQNIERRAVSGVGFWKLNCKKQQILCESTSTEMGTRSILVFHSRSSSRDYNRTDWVIHEYNLNPSSSFKHVKEMPFVACCLRKKKKNNIPEIKKNTHVRK